MRLRRPLALATFPLVVAAALAVVPGVAGNARRGTTATDVAVVSDHLGATLTLLDGRAREGLTWLLPGDAEVAFAPDGQRIAFSSARDGNREIYVADVVSGRLARLTQSPGREDAMPAWSPTGRWLVWATGTRGEHDLRVMRPDGSGKRWLVRQPGDDVDPDWAPGGEQIAFASNGDGRFRLWTVSPAGGDASALGDLPGHARGPAWHPTGDRIAYTGVVSANADVWVVTADGFVAERFMGGKLFEGRPQWSADGSRLGFLRGRGALEAWLADADGSRAHRIVTGVSGIAAIDLARVGPELAPREDAILPDLDQRPPAELVIRSEKNRVWLGFASAVDNVGRGPLRIRGTRRSDHPTMRADQIVELRGGGAVARRAVGELRYEMHPPHRHWHLQPFDRYELRRVSDGALLRSDRKTGFCLLDRWGIAPLPPGTKRNPPRFLGTCGAGKPDARSVEEGSSVGYTDRYPQFFHGQEVDVTTIPAGLYVLVHHANPERRLRELTYANNVASVLLRLRRPPAPSTEPTVEVLRVCDRTDRCPPSSSG